MRITRYNWKEVLNDPPMKFETFVNGSYCPIRMMKNPNGYNQIRYIEPEDVIITIKKRIENQLNPESGKSTKDRLRWIKITKAAEKLIVAKNLEKE